MLFHLNQLKLKGYTQNLAPSEVCPKNWKLFPAEIWLFRWFRGNCISA